jgi:hypothetical protein
MLSSIPQYVRFWILHQIWDIDCLCTLRLLPVHGLSKNPLFISVLLDWLKLDGALFNVNID